MARLSTGKRKRQNLIGVVLNDEEYKAITEDAASLGMTRSAYCRMILVEEHNKRKEKKR